MFRRSVMEEGLYNVKITCPVCSKDIEVTKVKSKACKISSRDSDFCVYYEGLNPIFYDIWVCEYCGYAAQQERFESISSKEASLILRELTPRWVQRSFNGERTVDAAIEAFKLALYNLQLVKGKSSDIAKICVRLAWMYRLKTDQRETEFLKFALKAYMETFEKENLPVDKLDQNTCMYMIGELSRRTGDIEEAVKWFSRLISSPDARKNQVLMENVREQYHLAKGHMKK